MQHAPAVSRVVGYAYPWDVIGDPGFAERVRSTDIAQVALAASYHGRGRQPRSIRSIGS